MGFPKIPILPLAIGLGLGVAGYFLFINQKTKLFKSFYVTSPLSSQWGGYTMSSNSFAPDLTNVGVSPVFRDPYEATSSGDYSPDDYV